MRPKTQLVECLALVVATLVTGCSVNPATGQRQLSLINEQQEIAMGRESNQQILDTMTQYADSAVQDYVAGIGKDLARRTERPDLPWTFVVLDDPAVNAFAIPGGHVYITRGILGYMNSEAELASVLGHEIGHVTARHSVEQMSKQQLLGLGLGIGAIVSPEFARYQELAKTGAGLLLLKYSRADEAQADELGLRYMVAGGYDGHEMPKVFRTLERVSEAAADGQRLPNWLSTHPAPGNRFATISADVARLGTRAEGRIERSAYLAHVDGMAFGADPRQGYFRAERFYHPELKFQVEFPAGWTTSNEVQRVAAISPEKDALVQVTISDKPTTDAALQAFAEQEGVSTEATRSFSSHGLDGVQVEFSAESQGKSLRGRAVYLSYRQTIYGLLAFGTAAQWDARSAVAETALSSFQPLTEKRYLDVEPARIAVVTVSRSMTVEAFARDTGSSTPAATLAIINELEPGESLRAGEQAKTVRGGELPR
jgi:predicted Zn-dependent protease